MKKRKKGRAQVVTLLRELSLGEMTQAEVYDAEPTSLFGIGRFFSPPFRLITPVFLSTSSFSYYEGLTNPIFLSLCFTTCL